jgi:hypothetical protein
VEKGFYAGNIFLLPVKHSSVTRVRRIHLLLGKQKA